MRLRLTNIFTIALLISSFIISCAPHSSKTKAAVQPGVSKSGQEYQWSEAYGKKYLADIERTVTTAEAWVKRAQQIRTQILAGAGLNPLPEKCPLKPIIGDRRIFDGYTVTNLAFESLPGVYVTGSLYSPLNANGRIPAVLSPHGHWPNKDDYGRYRPDVQKRCAAMARMGAMVFSYDMVGYGQLADFGWTHEHPETMKLQIWNSIRAVDLLISMGADSAKIACTGASGGGTQTFLVAAVDPRIYVSVPVVMVSYRHFGGCVCELGMPVHGKNGLETNNVEIAACMAPKPLLLISVGTDATVSTPDVEYPFIRNIYGLFHKAEMAENAHLPNDEHGYDYNKRAAAYPFIAKHLGLDLSKAINTDGTLNEEGIVIEKQEDLYTFDESHLFPKNGVRNYQGVVWDWKKDK